MNTLSFFRFPWYLSGVFILVVVVLILVCITAFKGVSPLIIILSSFLMTLLVFYNGYDGLSVVLSIKPGVCGLGSCGSGVCGFIG